ncbi:PRKC apoptosis WT1 regulator protein isoform X1 [Anguilla rostrata]|uniref:PRKC apoptosis WT1 regulator protein isoform X1 n=1 Tax=Anguilla rostrata TaxID=7938 RepID=UPI0030CBA41E
MATGGFRSSATTDFLEEWKAKREKMRMRNEKMLGEGTASSLGTNSKSETRNTSQSPELNNNGNPDRGGPTSVNCASSHPVVRSSSSSALRRPDDDPHSTPATRGSDPPVGHLKKAPQPEKVIISTPQPESSGNAYVEDDTESPTLGTSSSKGKEKKSTGPSARRGKGQIEKRKLREKRRSTGVVSMPSNESLDELDDDDGVEKEKKEEELTQLNTVQNEALTSDPATAQLSPESQRAAAGRYRSSPGPGAEEEAGGGGGGRHRPGYGRHGRESGSAGGLERKLEELEKELARERQEFSRLLKAHEDKDELILKLKEEIDLLNRDLDDIEDENEQLKQENKTLLKVVGQLTSSSGVTDLPVVSFR